jgi:hypothetical protein
MAPKPKSQPDPMNTEFKFHLKLEPREELGHLVTILAGALASGKCVPSTGTQAVSGDGEMPIARDISRQLLEQLRWDVERRVEEFPDRYTGLPVDELLTE